MRIERRRSRFQSSARVRRQRRRAAAVEVKACDDLLHRLRPLYRGLGVRRADLVDEEGLLDGVGGEDGFRLAMVGYDTGHRCAWDCQCDPKPRRVLSPTIDNTGGV